MARNRTETQTETASNEKATRQRKRFALLIKVTEDGEWQEIGILSTQRDAKETANAIRKLGEMMENDYSELKFTSRVVSGETEEF